MVDSRFHPVISPTPLEELLVQAGHERLVGGGDGGSRLISGAAELAVAGPSDVAMALNSRFKKDLQATRAGCVLVTPEFAKLVPPDSVALVSKQAQDIFVAMLEVLYAPALAAGHGSLAGGERPESEDDVYVGPNVVFGAGVEIGRGSRIEANSVIGAGVAIGRNTLIGPNCTLSHAFVGDDVIVHTGARIGSEGFGWTDLGRSNRKFPQLGRVILQNRVEIGANTTIDRGALGDTVIGEGTKIDNLVQIGHNCQIGRNCLIAGTVALAGSTVIEDRVLMGGGSGAGGHLTIGKGTIVLGRAGVTKSWPPGSKLFGTPAEDVRQFWREQATLRRLTKGGKR